MIELRRGDEVTQTFRDGQLVAALRAFWFALLEEGRLYERWYRTQLSVRGRDLVVPRDDEQLLNAIGVRRFETHFLDRVAELHSRHLRGAFELEQVLALEPQLPREVQRVVDLLRKSFSITAPLRHCGELGKNVRPAGAAPLTVLESLGIHANGAGGMTWSSMWRLELREPLRLVVVIDTADEEGMSLGWNTRLEVPLGTSIEPLLDAFREQNIHFSFERVAAPEEG